MASQGRRIRDEQAAWPRTSRAVAVCFVVASASCTLAPGEPWGTLEAALTVAFDPPAARLDAEGRLLTAKSYALAFDEVVAHVGALTVTQGAPDVTPAAFDPARPPPGFSLCHNGHCHADDGRLVAYAEVAAAASGTASSAPALEFDVAADVSLGTSPTDVDATCGADPCLLARGPLIAASLDIERIELRGTAFDVLDDARLPSSGRAFDVTLTLPGASVAPLDATVERFEPVHRQLEGAHALAPSVLDDVDFATDLEAGGGLAASIATAAALTAVEDSTFRVTLLAREQGAP